jgi:uncharacterized protein
MKYLIVLLVVVVGLWLVWGRRGRRVDAPSASHKGKPKKAAASAAAQNMVACAHCDVHLPEADAVKDAAQRPFCSEAHRLAGPR